MVVEEHRHHREPEERGAADVGLLLHRVHGYLDGDADKFLNFFGRAAGPLRDDGHLGLRHVGEGIDRRLLEAHHASHHRYRREQQHQCPLAQRGADNAVDKTHGSIFIVANMPGRRWRSRFKRTMRTFMVLLSGSRAE